MKLTIRILGIVVLIWFVWGTGKALVVENRRLRNMDNSIKLEEGHEHTFEDLLDAIEWVESKGDANAVGDNGNAIGAYQLWKIYVDDVNWILKLRSSPARFAYDDRRDKERSRMMVEVYLNYYWKKAMHGYYAGKYDTFEIPARTHNGGPDGWKKEPTKAYWLKVKARLVEIK